MQAGLKPGGFDVPASLLPFDAGSDLSAGFVGLAGTSTLACVASR